MTTIPPSETPRRGDWSQTYTGKKFYPLDPRPEDVVLDDISRALGHLCRFNGHCSFFYSVAQHSLLVSRLMEGLALADGKEGRTAAIEGLFHDAAEAYICDLPRPLKASLRMVGQPFYDEAEEAIQGAVSERFGITFDTYRRADNAALYLEAEKLMRHAADWNNFEEELSRARGVAATAMAGLPVHDRKDLRDLLKIRPMSSPGGAWNVRAQFDFGLR